MTVKELKEKLEQFPDNCIVFIPSIDQTPSWYAVAKNVTQGINEMDGCVFIDDYVEEDDDYIEEE